MPSSRSSDASRRTSPVRPRPVRDARPRLPARHRPWAGPVGSTGGTGHGSARCRPEEVEAPEVGDELAASRAMSDLAARLMRTAYGDTEGVRASARGGRSGSDRPLKPAGGAR
ncbi:dsRBD fold-containing protein [Streptomyces lydicus]|uniref:dsRBD fold-containing protein n=1 Tax=Streptomyces lydicus TaxID=47763 RepID=UPI0037AE19DE